MSLKKCFNQKFAWQNLKKSKGTLALFLGIIPILNSLILLLFCSNHPLSPSLLEISVINMIGLYILPIVISLCLFQYIFKKKSVDFLGSMPISRQSIFITNTLVGIFLILGMQLTNVLFIYVVGSVTSSIIPFQMLVDYFLIWSLAYIFAFIISNVAVAISGNGITSIIVSLIFLCIVPFLYDYATTDFWLSTSNTNIRIECKDKACIPKYRVCYSTDTCDLEKKQIYDTYAKDETRNKNFTFLYNLPRQMIDSKGIELYNRTVIIKTIFFSVAGGLLGLYLFKKRKLENNETSFKSNSLHALFKGLLLMPIPLLFYNSIDNDIALLLMATFVIGYYFLYDLITRKSIGKFFETCKYLIVTVVFIFAFIKVTDYEHNKTRTLTIRSDQVESFTFEDRNLSFSDEDYPVIYDRKIINVTLQNILTEYPSQKDIRGQDMVMKTKNGERLRFRAFMSSADYDQLVEVIKESQDYKKYQKFNSKKVYAYRIGQEEKVMVMDSAMRKALDDALKQGILTGPKTDATYIDYIYFISYQNGKQQYYQVPTNSSHMLEERVVKELKNRNIEVASRFRRGMFRFSYVMGNVDLSVPYQYFFPEMQEELIEFTKRYKEDEIDLYQDYMVLFSYSNDMFITNRVDEFLRLIWEKHEQLIDDPDYQEWLINNDFDFKLGEDYNGNA